MNILFTNFCNRNCAYCFAKGKLQIAKHMKDCYISFENLKISIDFMKKSKVRTIGVLGGEPTLHPEFKQAMQMLLENGFNITLFTNGIIKKDIVLFLKETEARKVKVILNIDEPEHYVEKEWTQIERTMKILGNKLQLGFTIYRTTFNMNFMLQLIETHNLVRGIRLGIASPIFGQNNKYLSPEEHKKIIPKIITFSNECDKLNVSFDFDCGFMLCSFTERNIGKIYYNKSLVRAVCNPVIDIGPDLSVWRCFATSMIYNKKLTDFEDVNEIEKFYNKKFRVFRKIGAKKECFSCKYLERSQCGGGCLGYTLKTLNLEGKLDSAKIFNC